MQVLIYLFIFASRGLFLPTAFWSPLVLKYVNRQVGMDTGPHPRLSLPICTPQQQAVCSGGGPAVCPSGSRLVSDSHLDEVTAFLGQPVLATERDEG